MIPALLRVTDWSKYPSFSEKELACRQTGECAMHILMMDKLQELRNQYGKPITITSGYRSPRHSIEIAKSAPGEHAYGMAVDIACNGVDAMQILRIALELNIMRIGVQQKGSGRFIHLGIGDKSGKFPPAIWSY